MSQKIINIFCHIAQKAEFKNDGQERNCAHQIKSISKTVKSVKSGRSEIKSTRSTDQMTCQVQDFKDPDQMTCHMPNLSLKSHQKCEITSNQRLTSIDLLLD